MVRRIIGLELLVVAILLGAASAGAQVEMDPTSTPKVS